MLMEQGVAKVDFWLEEQLTHPKQITSYAADSEEVQKLQWNLNDGNIIIHVLVKETLANPVACRHLLAYVPSLAGNEDKNTFLDTSIIKIF